MSGRSVRDVLSERFEGESVAGASSIPTIGEGFDAPPRLREESEFHWFHPPMQGTRFLCILSRDPLWYAGHYARGRMRLCRGHECDQCAVGVGRQLRYVVCAVDLSSREVGFLEVGAGPGEQLRHHVETGGGLRGTVCALSRASRSKNSRLVLELLPEVAPGWARDLPVLSVQSAMSQTWARAEALDERKAHT